MSTNNTIKSRTIGAIALISGRERNGYYFMSLATGKLLNALNWTKLTIKNYVINRVGETARSDKQPIMTMVILYYIGLQECPYLTMMKMKI